MVFNLWMIIFIILNDIPLFIGVTVSKPLKLNFLYPPQKYINKELIYQLSATIGYALFCLVFQYFLIFYRFENKPGYLITNNSADIEQPYYEPFYFFVIFGIQNILIGIAFSAGYPFKEVFYKNIILILIFIINMAFITIIFYYEYFQELPLFRSWNSIFKIPELTEPFRLKFLFYMILNIIGTVSIAKIV